MIYFGALLTGAMLFAAPPQPTAPTRPMHAEAAEPGDPDEAGITWADPNDATMNAARDQARAELPAFFARMAKPGADETMFVVKFDLGFTKESIWAVDLRREGGRLTGELSNTPLHPDYRLGQRVEIPQEAIIDWGHFRGRTMQGNYTTRVQLDVMDPEEARQVRAAFGW
jgi:uncharacterized protein YegJ (DUF2314 family)